VHDESIAYRIFGRLFNGIRQRLAAGFWHPANLGGPTSGTTSIGAAGLRWLG
jgi:hypothetical protein